MLALTATATRDIVKIVIECLNMVNVNTIGASPDRSNIKYHIVLDETMDGLCRTIADELTKTRCQCYQNGENFQTLKQCEEVYCKTNKLLGKYITEPPGVPAILPFRIIALLTSASRLEIRAEIFNKGSAKSIQLYCLRLHKRYAAVLRRFLQKSKIF